MEPAIAKLAAAQDVIIKYAVGKSVQLKDAQGKRQYFINGPGAPFTTEKDAAVDGIALSFFVESLTGDHEERMGFIHAMEADPQKGPFTYDRLYVGTHTTKDQMINGKLVPKGTPTTIATMTEANTVAYFHIHPHSAELSPFYPQNKKFDDADEYQYHVLSNQDPTPHMPDPHQLKAYLGAIDGSFHLLEGGHWTNDIKLEDPGFFQVPYVH